MANYRKTYLCLCEGQQEIMYLNHVASLIKDFPRKVVKFQCVEDAPYRLSKRYEDYDSAALFDFDFNESEFKKNIQICDELNKQFQPTKRKTGRKIYHAYSNVNFDLWLILHKEDCNGCVYKNNGYIRDVRRIYGLSSTDNIKHEDVIQKILKQITLSDVQQAIRRAQRIRRDKDPSDGIVVRNTVYYSNPDFSIHDFLIEVLTASGDL